jgi:SAM-dependent methyltransferase
MPANPSTHQAHHHWQFPLAAQGSRARAFARAAAGRLLATLQPAVVRRLEAGEAPRNRNERLLLAGLVARHRARGSLERLAAQHTRFWEGPSAVHFHAATEARCEEDLRGPHALVFDLLVEAFADNRLHSLCEIGCGSGRVLAEAAARLAALTSLVGLDLSAAQSAANQSRHADPRLSFVAADAQEWIPIHTAPGWGFLSYGGVLEYFTQDALTRLFDAIASCAPAGVVLVEPLGDDFELASDTRSRPYGQELSFSHNYPHLLERAGLRITRRHEYRVRGLRWIALAARADA